jgi:hypothetical protein
LVGRRAGGARNHSKGNRRPDDWQRIETGDSAKVQIGAVLLCKSVTHAVRERDRGRDRVWVRKILSGLGSRQSGARFRCSGSGTGSGFNFPAPAPVPDNPHLRPEGRDLGPESASYVCIFAARSARSADPTYYSCGNLEPVAEGRTADTRRADAPVAVTSHLHQLFCI